MMVMVMRKKFEPDAHASSSSDDVGAGDDDDDDGGGVDETPLRSAHRIMPAQKTCRRLEFGLSPKST